MRPRLVAALVASVVSVAACGGDGAATSTAEAVRVEPEAVARSFVDALVDEAYDRTADFVDERHLAFLIAVERGTAGEVAGMLRSGVPASVRTDFWESFSDSLPTYTGESIGRIQVGSVTDRFEQGGRSFAVIDVFVAGGQTEWLLWESEDGWLLDLLATFGTGFLPNLRGWFAFIGADDDAGYIRDQFERELPSLRAGLDRLPLGPLSDEAQAAADELLADFSE